MKRVFFISIMALACMVCTTSCGDDEPGGGDATLTGITVTPANFKGAVDAVQKITATPVPANATLGTLTWASSASSVATVDQSGIVKITGVGTAEVTVTSGTISQKVSVEGTISGLTVTDGDSNSAGTYPYNGTPIIVELTATIAPPNSGKTPVWSSSAATATVVAASDGLTAEVTITGEGAAIITADVDGVTATYAISTTSVFESAAGYWTFNDAANLGKATRGEDLIFALDSIDVVDGPSDTKKAIQLIKDANGLLWNHSMPADVDGTESPDAERQNFRIKTYTILIDAKPYTEDRVYHSILGNESFDNSLFTFRPRDGALTIAHRGTAINVYADYSEPKWIRLVAVVAYNPDVDPEWAFPYGADFNFYANGEYAGTSTRLYTGTDSWTTDYMNVLYSDLPVRFLRSTPDGTNSYPVSTIAVWNRALTAEEIASLGGVSK
jgi:uncharacterized protein YjdB